MAKPRLKVGMLLVKMFALCVVQIDSGTATTGAKHQQYG
jgi:hypothetical protein